MHCHRFRLPCARQQGAALVVALLIFAVCAALGVALAREFQLHFQRAANLLQGEQVYAYFRGAEDLASLALAADYEQDQAANRERDDLTEIWAEVERRPAYPLDEGWALKAKIEDLQGRFNLNHLRQPPAEGSQFSPHQQQFIRLLQALPNVEVSRQHAIQITQSVRDWLDTDNAPSPNGAEDDVYLGAKPAYRAANRPMVSSSELLAVANMTPEIFHALQPWVTVWPQSPELLNIHTAYPIVLRSINADDVLEPLALEDMETLVQDREDSGFANREAFFQHAAFSGIDETKRKGLEVLVGETSNNFLLISTVNVADRNQRLYSVLQRNERDIQVLARASGSL